MFISKKELSRRIRKAKTGAFKAGKRSKSAYGRRRKRY